MWWLQIRSTGECNLQSNISLLVQRRHQETLQLHKISKRRDLRAHMVKNFNHSIMFSAIESITITWARQSFNWREMLRYSLMNLSRISLLLATASRTSQHIREKKILKFLKKNAPIVETPVETFKIWRDLWAVQICCSTYLICLLLHCPVSSHHENSQNGWAHWVEREIVLTDFQFPIADMKLFNMVDQLNYILNLFL